MYKIRKRFVLIFALLCPWLAKAQDYAGDTLVSLLRDEVKYYYEHLSKRDVPVYFLSFRVVDNHTLTLSGEFGLSNGSESHTRIFRPHVRVGNSTRDNYMYSASSSNLYVMGDLPLNCSSLPALKEEIWDVMEYRYGLAVKDYEAQERNRKSVTSPLDSIPSFSAAPVSVHYEAPMTQAETYIDKAKWQAYVDEASREFRQYKKQLGRGNVELLCEHVRSIVVNSEGTLVAQNRRAYRVVALATAKAAEGTDYRIMDDCFAYTLDELPPLDSLKRMVHNVAERVIALSRAPMADPYTGPAILSGKASAVFFHEVLGHRLEGKRTQSVNNELNSMMHRQILPASFQLYFDPTLTSYAGHPLNGHYLYDDEGTKARRVDCVKDGVLQQLLMSRSPVKGFAESNGHARGEINKDPNPRQSNFIIEPTQMHTEAELRAMLRQELKRQNLEYGYLFATASDGFTTVGGTRNVNSFNVNPVETYRVYADGRPDELVRGVSLIGTPLNMFSNIVAAGGEMMRFTGYCGAQSGQVPVSTVASTVFVAQVETQGKKSVTTHKDEHVDLPEEVDVAGLNLRSDRDIIFRMMDDEMPHVQEQWAKQNEQKPLLLDFLMSRKSDINVYSSLGSCNEISPDRIATSMAVDVTLGDSMGVTNGIARGFTTMALDYNDFRAKLCELSHDAYRNAILQWDEKLKERQKAEPDNDDAIPYSRMPAAVSVSASALQHRSTPEQLAALADKLSAVFLDYPELYNTQVHINQTRTDYYRLTSEGQKILQPISMLNIRLNADAPTSEDKAITTQNVLRMKDMADVAPEKLMNEVRQFAERTLHKAKAERCEDFYVGPVLYEGEMVPEIYWDAIRKALDKKYLGKQVLGEKMSVTQTNDSIFAGVRLVAARPTDANGVVPRPLTFIDKGFLRSRLAGRYLREGRTATTGNEAFKQFTGSSIGVGYELDRVYRITFTDTKPYNKVRKELLRLARKAGNRYAYIIRTVHGSYSQVIRVDVDTNEETEVRSQITYPHKMELKDVVMASEETNAYNRSYQWVISGYGCIVPKAVLLRSVEMDMKKNSEMSVDHDFFRLRH